MKTAGLKLDILRWLFFHSLHKSILPSFAATGAEPMKSPLVTGLYGGSEREECSEPVARTMPKNPSIFRLAVFHRFHAAVHSREDLAGAEAKIEAFLTSL